MPRKATKHLISTYVARRSSGKYGARVTLAATTRESRCTKEDPAEAARCAREKIST